MTTEATEAPKVGTPGAPARPAGVLSSASGQSIPESVWERMPVACVGGIPVSEAVLNRIFGGTAPSAGAASPRAREAN